MIYSQTGYCRCGEEIWLEYIRDGQAWRPRFSDGEGREITRCPRCGVALKEDDLESL